MACYNVSESLIIVTQYHQLTLLLNFKILLCKESSVIWREIHFNIDCIVNNSVVRKYYNYFLISTMHLMHPK